MLNLKHIKPNSITRLTNWFTLRHSPNHTQEINNPYMRSSSSSSR